MNIWRGLWSFHLTDDHFIPAMEFASDLHADYLWQSGNRFVIISKLVRQKDTQYLCHWFRHIEFLLEHCDSISNSLFTTSAANYSETLIQLHKELGNDLKIHVLSDKHKLLMCDLGDVIWDECPAQEHMRNIARKVLLETGCEITEQQWTEEYCRAAEKSSGDRFYQCVSSFTDASGVQAVRDAVNQDFLAMEDSDYIALHPLRNGVLECFFDIYRAFEICFVANQPVKAYRLLQEYNIGLISPVWFLSCKMGIRKPDPAIFRISLECMRAGGKHYSEYFMLGNRKEMDLVPSLEVGAKGILFLCQNSPICERDVHKEYTAWRTVTSIPELRLLLLEAQ